MSNGKAKDTPASIDLDPEDACIILRAKGRKMELFIPRQDENAPALTQSRIAFTLAFAAGEPEVMRMLEEMAVEVATARMLEAGETPPPDLDTGGGEDSGPPSGETIH